MIIAAKTEEDIASLESYEDKKMFLDELGLEESGVSRLINKAYHLLNLQTFITAGEMEVKAWTFHKGWKAPQCAGVIHTDFEKGLIRLHCKHKVQVLLSRGRGRALLAVLPCFQTQHYEHSYPALRLPYKPPRQIPLP